MYILHIYVKKKKGGGDKIQLCAAQRVVFCVGKGCCRTDVLKRKRKKCTKQPSAV